MPSGYGSQALALKYLGLPFEHWKTCEWAVKSIQAYKDIHFTEKEFDYSKKYKKDELVNILHSLGISQNYNEPMTFQQISRLGETQLRKIYNNIKTTHNLVNIQQVKGEDLEIVDTNDYTYIMTYSFPKPIKLDKKLKDLLEDNVDEKYYLSDAMIKCFTRETQDDKFPRGERFKQALKLTNEKNIAGTITTTAGNRATDNFIITKETENYIEWKEKGKLDVDCRAFKDDKVSGTIMTTPKNKIQNGLRIRKLSPRECWRLMGVKDEDYEKCAINQSNASLYHLAGDSIVVNILCEIFKELL